MVMCGYTSHILNVHFVMWLDQYNHGTNDAITIESD